jgi:hypothetical protein
MNTDKNRIKQNPGTDKTLGQTKPWDRQNPGTDSHFSPTAAKNGVCPYYKNNTGRPRESL